MASAQITFLSSVLFILLLHRYSSFVKADAALEASVCSKTQEPGYCQKCFDSFFIIKKKDTVRDLAGVAIDCAIYQSSTVGKILDHYSQTTHLPEIKQCVDIYTAVNNMARDAVNSWMNNQYAKAGSSLDSAKSAHLNCFNLLVRAKRFIPADFTNAFYTLRAYDDVAKNVLTQIK